MFSILICDDQSIVRDGLSLMIELEDDLHVIAQAENGEIGVLLCQQHQPDLVLMDLNMPKVNGVEACQKILAINPEQKILVLTTFDDEEWLFAALKAGAKGYLLKDTSREELMAAIRGTLAGQNFIDPNVAGQLLQKVQLTPQITTPDWLAELSVKERKVLTLISQGKNNHEISERLFLSAGTIKNYVSAVFVKMGVSDRTQAAIAAVKLGLDKE